MTPLHVRARVPGAICLPSGEVALDALLMAARALRDNLPPTIDGLQRIDIPVAIEPGGRFHLASFARSVVVEYERRWINRRFPVAEAQMLADAKFKRVNVSAGPTKSYRIPLEVGYLSDGALDWWCVGDEVEVRALASLIHGIGKKRSVGHGAVEEWTVDECEPWEGFPVVRDGRPLRPLPVDWPGIVDADVAQRVLGCVAGPYWQSERAEVCMVPLC